MRPPDARHACIVVLWATAVAARAIVGAHVTDDAYITMRYSRNLTATGTLAYNPPDRILGTSTPLWTAVLASASLAGGRPESAAIAAATAADLASIALLLASASGTSAATLVSASTIAAWPAYVAYAVSGMETSLYVLTIVATATAASAKRWTTAAIAASLAALCRPDGALVVVLGAAWAWVAGGRSASLRVACLSALACAPWAAFATATFGSLLPSSVAAKAAAADPWWVSVRNVYAYFSGGPYALTSVLALAGFVAIATRYARTGASDPVFLLSVWAWCYLAAMTAANGFTHFPWYFVPLLPVYTALAAAALEIVFSMVRRWLPPEGGRGVSRSLPDGGSYGRRREGWAGVALAVALGAGLLGRMPALGRYLDANAAGREQLYALVAAELAGADPRCTVAATEIGTIGYHYPGRILDLVGLVNPEVVGRPVAAVLAESDARWLVTYDTHFDRHVAEGEMFTRLYERRRTIPVADSRALEVYERRESGACANH